jgi:1,4-dihydroxy-2-naphthoate polyprenyltransferase
VSKKNLLSWLKAIRPFTFAGSVIPVTLGAVAAMRETSFQAGYFILSILAIVSLQAGVNLQNDYDDYSNKVDTIDSQLSSGVIIQNLLKPEEVLLGSRISMLLGILIGLYLTMQKGVFILIIGIIGVLVAYFYTGKPLTLKYRGLGAPFVFILFGPFMVIGSYYVQAQRVSISSVLLSVPVGLLTTAILHANDIRDICLDQKAGIKTLSILVGERYSHKIYNAFLLISYAAIILMVIYRVIPYLSLVCFATIPSAFKCMKKLRANSNQSAVLATFDKETAELDAKFGGILILSMLVPNFIR